MLPSRKKVRAIEALGFGPAITKLMIHEAFLDGLLSLIRVISWLVMVTIGTLCGSAVGHGHPMLAVIMGAIGVGLAWLSVELTSKLGNQAWEIGRVRRALTSALAAETPTDDTQPADTPIAER